MGRTFSHSRTYVQTLALGYFYMGADKSLARPGRKQATATEDFDVHSIIIIGIQPLGRFGQRTELSGDLYGSGTLHPGQVLGGSLPLLSPAFRRSHFRHQVLPRPPRRERS